LQKGKIGKGVVYLYIIIKTMEAKQKAKQGIVKSKPNDFFTDFLNLQRALGNLDRTAKSFKGKYTPLPNVLDYVKPILNNHNFILINQIGEGVVYVILRHVSGETIQASHLIPNVTDAQSLGSYITYLRRYLTVLVLNITSDEDDDGSKAVNKGDKALPSRMSVNETFEKLKKELESADDDSIFSVQSKIKQAKTQNLITESEIGVLRNILSSRTK
jgi:hypothetical protein